MRYSFDSEYMGVAEIINGWDPISLFPYAPEDEYYSELNLVKQVMSCCLNANELADKIYNIFSRAFGDLFVETKQECLYIADKLLMLKKEK